MYRSVSKGNKHKGYLPLVCFLQTEKCFPSYDYLALIITNFKSVPKWSSQKYFNLDKSLLELSSIKAATNAFPTIILFSLFIS